MTRSFWKLIVLLVVASLMAASAAAAIAVASTPHQVRLGGGPQAPAGSSVTGSLAASTPINATLVLKPSDPAGLQQYATAVSTPGSPLYHQYLSVAEFRQRFGPTDAQISAVTSSLRAHGLAPGPVSANGLALPIASTAGTLGHAFSTSFHRLSLPGGRQAFANTQAPQLDASVAGNVQSVLGLSSVAEARPLALRTAHAKAHSVRRVATGGPQPCAAASASGFYTADQLAYAYRFSPLYGAGDRGAGQTVAIYELEGNYPSDISQDEACYGIGAPVSYVRVDGGPPAPSLLNQDGLETALDVEQVINLAPQANVIVYQGPNSASGSPGSGPYDTYNAIISQNRASIISTSWGECESQLGSGAADAENTLFQEAAVQGESTFSADGDEGSTDCTDAQGNPLPSLAVDDPSAQPFVTGVGGTSMSSLGPPPSESVWNDSCSGAPCSGGGGISQFWAMPSYQSSAGAPNVVNGNSSAAPCSAVGTDCREVPDVSANSDPSTGDAVFYHGSWGGIGGTSAAAPVFAALMTLANASSACGGAPIGFANPVLYGTAGHVYSDFNDVTAGSNDILGTGRFPAGPGYDMASGLGSPNAAALAANLCAPAIGLTNPGAQTSMIHTAARVQISASDSSGRPVGYSATGLPYGLSIASTTGAITGTTTRAGLYSVTVRAVDSRGSLGSTTFSWNVRAHPQQSGVSLTGIGKGKPKLAFTVTAGNFAPALEKLVISLPRGLSFDRQARKLRKGITLTGPNRKRVQAKLVLSKGRLTITVASGKTQLHFTIRIPGIVASKGLITKVKRKKSGKLRVTVTVTDVGAVATTLWRSVKPR